MYPIIQTIDSLLAGAHMKLQELAQKIGARVLTPAPADSDEVTTIYAGDRVSDLLNEASDKTLLVTNLANLQMVRVAELMEVPGHLLRRRGRPGAGGHRPRQPRTTPCSWSRPLGVFETCGLIYQLLSREQQRAHRA